MACDWRPLVELISRSERFLLTTHVRPDGDGLGSLKALSGALRALGKAVQMTVTSAVPPRYAFLDREGEFVRFVPPGDHLVIPDVLMILDTGTWNQLSDMSDFVRQSSASKVVIDHHLTQDDLGAQSYVDTTAEATGRLVHELLRALGTPWSAEIANPLFVALAMDTGWFRHSNTTAETFALAADLVAEGAQPTELYGSLFECNTLGRLRLMGLVLDRLTVSHGGNVASSFVRKSDYEQTGAIPPDSEDLVNYTLSIHGVEVGLLFMEQPRGGVKVSFRGRGFDVRRLAEQFGGGGHAAAAGATLQTTLEDAQAKVHALLTEGKWGETEVSGT